MDKAHLPVFFVVDKAAFTSLKTENYTTSVTIQVKAVKPYFSVDLLAVFSKIQIVYHEDILRNRVNKRLNFFVHLCRLDLLLFVTYPLFWRWPVDRHWKGDKNHSSG